LKDAFYFFDGNPEACAVIGTEHAEHPTVNHLADDGLRNS
jgi:hypothetical protein